MGTGAGIGACCVHSDRSLHGRSLHTVSSLVSLPVLSLPAALFVPAHSAPALCTCDAAVPVRLGATGSPCSVPDPFVSALPSPPAPQLKDSAAPDSAAPESADPLEASLVPVTPLAPLHPDIPLNVKARKGSKQAAASSPHAPQPPQDASAPAAGRSAAHQVTLLPVTIGKGAYGRVVEGLYGGQRVAVKVIDTGLMAVALLEEARAAEGASGSTGTGSGTSGSLGAVVGLGGGDGGVGPERAVRALTATLAQEVEVLARCQHPNVVRLLAANLRLRGGGSGGSGGLRYRGRGIGGQGGRGPSSDRVRRQRRFLCSGKRGNLRCNRSAVVAAGGTRGVRCSGGGTG